MKCKLEDELVEHNKVYHSKKTEEIFYSCKKCDWRSETENELRVHTRQHHFEQTFKCNECDKSYTTMGRLRRHAWRCHREIECNFCGETILNRQDIKAHRESAHNMYRKVFCKIFPDCMDEEECLFEHGNNEEANGGRDACANGKKCNDQSCK